MSQYVSAILRVAVSTRAGGCCEYCLLHEDEAMLCHEPDHVIARKHGGQTDADNLALACFLCNRFKGSDIASTDPQSGEIVRLYNPRKDQWTTHFKVDGGRIEPLTAEARATASLLQFNTVENVQMRASLAAAGRYPR